MESSFTWFSDTFRSIIHEMIVEFAGPYERFRNRYHRPNCMFFDHSEKLFDLWRAQLPTHQSRYLDMKSKEVPHEYFRFLIKEFDTWFANIIETLLTSGFSP